MVRTACYATATESPNNVHEQLSRSHMSSSTPAISSPLLITPTEIDVSEMALTPQNLEAAVRSWHNDGLVVVENVIPHSILDHLNEKMVQDAKELASKGENSPFNYNVGNLQIDPPPVRKWFDELVFLSESARTIVPNTTLLLDQLADMA